MIVGIVTGTLVIGVRFAFFEFNNLRQEIQASNSLITKILWVVLTIGFALLIAFLLKHNSSSKQSGEDQGTGTATRSIETTTTKSHHC